MTKTAHTPTPYIVKTTDDGDFTTRTIEIEGRPKGLSEVAIVTTGSFTDEVEEANAEFIVRACNSHDELVKLLELIVKQHKSVPDPRQIWINETWLPLAESALSKSSKATS